MLERILVANRGEIACRIIRGVQATGRRAVAVYSEADADAPHVRLADAAECIGAAPAAESYLNIEAVLRAAQIAGADAVHPGYGFLAENADFARACADAGLTFIGPPAGAIELMGNKAAAKRRMIEAGVPCVPGYEGEDQGDAAFTAAARDIGYPVMVKAAAGGGGRGMRRVEHEAELASALAMARSEAESAFGSGELILEKAVVDARHVEIQVFADDHGAVIHLGERDCSVQRRHQKVVEEAPCPVMTERLREAMGAAAADAARSIDYRGAGTVEFLLDASGHFYFLEMNTRLQVEHPVTEMVTGLDLVALQLRVAEGRALGIEQDEIALQGHAIEVRLYAEDPARDFMPATGRIELWLPPSGEGVRVDAGVATGSEISPWYDPMVAKIISHGETRDAARLNLIRALERTALFGVTNNRDFLVEVLRRPEFAEGRVTTAFLEKQGEGAFGGGPQPADAAVAALLEYTLAGEAALAAAVGVSPGLLGWSSAGSLVSRYRYELDGEPVDLAVSPAPDGTVAVAGAGGDWRLHILGREAHRARIAISDRMDDRIVDVLFHLSRPGFIHVSVDGRAAAFENLRESVAAAEEAGGGRVTAAMHGLITEIAVAPGASVTRGTRLLVLEAMKMQHEVRAEIDGVVTAVHCEAGRQVAADELILEIEPADDDAA
ncbi:acetyl/propionyl/methylcrotonyl-CoA carboxylase subunit alpha [Lentisalinibacter orientalis]|uniref:acetyl/propionyl/methylcrotonyl-CoA carboxylase subunit alpha n=1 Tax=Lentisalinibacter orientalis TaxID=2992241 RepID=UPI00386E42C9